MLFCLSNHTLIRTIIFFINLAIITTIYNYWLWTRVEKFIYKLTFILPSFYIYKICNIFVFFKFELSLPLCCCSNFVGIRRIFCLKSILLEIFIYASCFRIDVIGFLRCAYFYYIIYSFSIRKFSEFQSDSFLY